MSPQSTSQSLLPTAAAFDLLSYRLSLAGAGDLAQLARQRKALGTPTPVHVHLVNSYSLVCASKDPLVDEALRGNAVNLMDGTPLAWLAKGRAVVPRNTQAQRGPSLFVDTLRHPDAQGLRHFFLGGTTATLAQLVEVVRHEYPEIQVADAYSPPFREPTAAEHAQLGERIEASDADIIWIGLGTPKQDKEAARLAKATGRVTVAVGAAFDFVAGGKPEAPTWLHNSGFEWAYRWASEPRRLTKRYLLGNMQFLKLCARHRFR